MNKVTPTSSNLKTESYFEKSDPKGQPRAEKIYMFLFSTFNWTMTFVTIYAATSISGISTFQLNLNSVQTELLYAFAGNIIAYIEVILSLFSLINKSQNA